MKIHIYQVMHVVSMILLTALVFQGFADPNPAKKKRRLMLSGILALVMLVGGFGLLTVYKIGFPIWIIVKLVCWFGLAGIGGMAYRKPEKIPVLTGITIALILIAVSCVYFRHQTGAVLE